MEWISVWDKLPALEETIIIKCTIYDKTNNHKESFYPLVGYLTEATEEFHLKWRFWDPEIIIKIEQNNKYSVGEPIAWYPIPEIVDGYL